jgi:hypothetical protein
MEDAMQFQQTATTPVTTTATEQILCVVAGRSSHECVLAGAVARVVERCWIARCVFYVRYESYVPGMHLPLANAGLLDRYIGTVARRLRARSLHS